MKRMSYEKRWLTYVSDPKYYNPNDWKTVDQREELYSTDFRKLLDNFRRKLLKFQDQHYGDNNKTGVGLSSPNCEWKTTNALCQKIIGYLNYDHEKHIDMMPSNQYMKWCRQNKNN